MTLALAFAFALLFFTRLAMVDDWLLLMPPLDTAEGRSCALLRFVDDLLDMDARLFALELFLPLAVTGVESNP